MATIGATSDETAIGSIAERVGRGECVLFLGAGVHYGPPDGSPYSYPDLERPLLGTALSERLASKCDFERRLPLEGFRNLQRVALCYETTPGLSRNHLVRQIREAVYDGKKPSPALRALAALPFPLVITTNYDQLFERALEFVGTPPRVTIYSPDPFTRTIDQSDISAKRPFLLKLHGDIDRPESIVVTDEDYIQFLLRMSDREPFHPVPETYLYHLKRWPTLFVGYSLMDYNLRLLFKILRWRIDPANMPDTYSVDKSPDPLILDVWWNQRRYVQFIAQDVWKFVPELYRRVMHKDMPA
jgi:hypothetical protein